MNSQASSSRTTAKRFDNPGTNTAGQKNQNKLGQNGQKTQSTTAANKTQPAESVKTSPSSNPPTKAAVPEAPKASTGLETSFHYDAPGATTVFLAGEFTQWDKTPIKMIKGGGGIWHTKVALPPGRHHYRFLVDGEWQNDPVHHERVANSFGTFNNIVDVH